jgi:hypothetical protein
METGCAVTVQVTGSPMRRVTEVGWPTTASSHQADERARRLCTRDVRRGDSAIGFDPGRRCSAAMAYSCGLMVTITTPCEGTCAA